MRYGQIRKYDVANGPGIRTSIFVTGCTRNCRNCFNKDYQNFRFGEIWDDDVTNEVISYLNLDEVAGLTILGGEPFENAAPLIDIVRKIRMSSKKSVWIYSGFTYEEICNDPKKYELLSLCDVLVDGPFIEEQKNLMLKFRGSANQRIIDIKKSIEAGKPIISME